MPSNRFNRRIKRTILHNKMVVKHIVDLTDLSATPGTVVHDIVVCADNPTTAVNNQVATKSRVQWVHVDLNWSLSAAPTGNTSEVFHWYIMFNPQGGLPNPAANNIGAQNMKQYVIKQGMAMVPLQSPLKQIGLLKIPKKYQVYNPGDKLQIVYTGVTGSANGDNFCGKFIYKELRA